MMSRVGKTIGLTIAVALVAVATSGAREIVRPVVIKVPYSAVPGGERIGKISAETRGGEEAGLLVVEKKRVDRRLWYGVRIAKRPNDRVGWVSADRVYPLYARYLIHVSLSTRTMSLFRDQERLWKTKVVIGAVETPTPIGLFAIHDFYRVDNELRPWVIETTAHSEVHKTFQGGPGRVAIHGRHGSLRVPWGIRASNGCIRAPDWALRSINRLAPVGTPIRIK